jgi:acyl-CoA thioester hydrolase
MARADFAFFHPLRVRWAEVDMQAIVFNGHYLTYFDVAFTEYWRATGLPGVM